MGMSESNTGFGFAVIGFAFMFGSPTAGFLAEKMPIRFVLQLGIIVIVIGLLLVGPTLFFGGLPDEIWIVMVGLFFLGFGAAVMFVPITPEMIQATKESYVEKLKKELLMQVLDEEEIEK